jgi:predicted enzyme related to lactoylglutathione lyase
MNHVALSIPAEDLSEESIKELLDFYGDVFGWEEMPTQTEPGRLLVMKVHTFTQFVYLHADKKPSIAHPRDHVGFQVDTVEDYDRVLERAKARRELDGGVTEVIGPMEEDYGPVVLRSYYVRHRLPIMWEIQYFQYKDAERADEIKAAMTG